METKWGKPQDTRPRCRHRDGRTIGAFRHLSHSHVALCLIRLCFSRDPLLLFSFYLCCQKHTKIHVAWSNGWGLLRVWLHVSSPSPLRYHTTSHFVIWQITSLFSKKNLLYDLGSLFSLWKTHLNGGFLPQLYIFSLHIKKVRGSMFVRLLWKRGWLAFHARFHVFMVLTLNPTSNYGYNCSLDLFTGQVIYLGLKVCSKFKGVWGKILNSKNRFGQKN